MKIFTSFKTLAIAASLLAAAHTTAAPKKATNGNIVIGKVFYAGSTRLNGATPKNYQLHLYVELYNNSADTVDVTGMYMALTNSDNAAQAWTATDMAEQHKDSIVVKQIFQIPTDQTRIVAPGQSIVITNSAIDHSQTAEGGVDLSGADFELKSTNKTYQDSHNDNVPALTVVSTFGTTDFMNLLTAGPAGVVLLASDTKVDNCPKTYPKGKSSGNQYTIVPGFKTIDAVDIVKQKSPSAADKRIPENYDKGFTCTTSGDAFTGELVYRKTAFVTSDGRKVLFDTNNSSADFACTTASSMPLRQYSSEVSGLTDTTIVIPASGYLAINPSKPFCGPRNMFFAFVNASNNNSTTDLKYTEYPGDSVLLIAGPWIAIAQPGEYTLKLSDSQGVVKTRSSIVNWCDEDSKTLTGGQATRRIYKFSNEPGKVGFERVPATDNKYNVADFTTGSRLYFALTDAIGNRIYEANGVASYDELTFIPWHGKTPADAAAGMTPATVRPTRADNAVFDLQGRRVNGQLRPGLYLRGGKKFVVK